MKNGLARSNFPKVGDTFKLYGVSVLFFMDARPHEDFILLKVLHPKYKTIDVQIYCEEQTLRDALSGEGNKSSSKQIELKRLLEDAK